VRESGVATVLVVYFRQMADVRIKHAKATIDTKPSWKPASAASVGASNLNEHIAANRPTGRLDVHRKDPGGKKPWPQGGASVCVKRGREPVLGGAPGPSCNYLLV
jgi:hypothetical protein